MLLKDFHKPVARGRGRGRPGPDQPRRGPVQRAPDRHADALGLRGQGDRDGRRLQQGEQIA